VFFRLTAFGSDGFLCTLDWGRPKTVNLKLTKSLSSRPMALLFSGCQSTRLTNSIIQTIYKKSSASSCACPACGCCYPTPAMPARNARYNSAMNQTATANIKNRTAARRIMLHLPSLVVSCLLRSCSVFALPRGSPCICCQSAGIVHWCGGNIGRARAGVCGIASMRCILRVSFRHAFYLPDY
jgi:hypothetical protein